jgi:hypothetical protein
MKMEIFANLKELHARQGVAFLSEQDAMDYYRELVELIEALINRETICGWHACRKAECVHGNGSAFFKTHR